MCIDAPESTTNYLSSGVFEDVAGNDQTSEREKNVLLSLSLSIRTFFRQIPCFSAGGFFLCSILDFLEFQDFAREVHTSEYLLAMDPLFPQLLRGEANLLRNARCALIPRILCSSQKSTRIPAAQNPGIRNPHASHDSLSQQIVFHNFSLDFAGPTVNLSVPEYALFDEFASRIRFVILTYGRMSIITRWTCTVSFNVISAPSLTSPS